MASSLTRGLRRWLDRLLATGEPELRGDLARIHSAEVADLPWLLAYVFDRRPEIVAVAGRALELQFSELTPEDLPRLDERLRSYRTPGRAWVALKSARLEQAFDSGEVSFPFCCFATGHPSGHVRETATRLIAETQDMRALPFLLIRANDWVGEVRVASRTALEPLVDSAPLDCWAESLPLVLRLEQCRRDDHRSLVSRVVARLSGPEAEGALVAGLRSPRRSVRWAVFEVGQRRSRPSPKFLYAAFEANDPTLRLHAARLACDLLSEDALSALAERLVGDSFPPVRMVALEIYRGRPAPEVRERLLEGLHDPSASIRGACQFYLRRDFAVECAREYRRAITSTISPSLVTSLSGLAETGRAEDAALALEFLEHPFARVRSAALRAAARLDSETIGQHFVDALADASPRVARSARDALLAFSAPAHGVAIRAVSQTAHYPHSRRCALEALASVSSWAYLADLLIATTDPAPEVVRRAGKALEKWLIGSNRRGTRPSTQQLNRVREAFDACVEHLDTELAQGLRFMIDKSS